MANLENSLYALQKRIEEEWRIDSEYVELYEFMDNDNIKLIMSSLHSFFVKNFEMMNQRLPTFEYTAHFWADDSRSLIDNIDMVSELFSAIALTNQACQYDEYYQNVISRCKGFLCKSGGSLIPANMEKIEIYYKIPMFELKNTIRREDIHKNFNLKHKGSGSYADVMVYEDEYYNTLFALKRAHKDLDEKELQRFKKEFDIMKKLDYPYILKVYSYQKDKNQYIMEYMDTTLYDYINKNNDKLTRKTRMSIINQILKAFEYLHSNNILHRDISPTNVLLKLYNDIIVVKISDFGLVKIPDSKMTSEFSELKGSFNDPNLILEGFTNYNIYHETYALTRLIVYILTGKTNYDKIRDNKLIGFLEKGLNPNKEFRFRSVAEMRDYIKDMCDIARKHDNVVN